MRTLPPPPTPARLLGFGLTVFLGFTALGVWLHLWALPVLGGAVLLLTPVRPVSTRLYTAWMALGLLLSRVTSPVVLLLLYLSVITPVALLSRLFRRDPLRLKPPPEGSCWEDRPAPGDAASYLRQY